VLLISKQKESPYFHVGTEDQGDIRLKEDRQTDGQNNREKPHFWRELNNNNWRLNVNVSEVSGAGGIWFLVLLSAVFAESYC